MLKALERSKRSWKIKKLCYEIALLSEMALRCSETLGVTLYRSKLMQQERISSSHPRGMAKRAFTLMEIMLVVALIGFALSAISIQVPKALRGETFERGVDRVKSRIALAQELMLDYQT